MELKVRRAWLDESQDGDQGLDEYLERIAQIGADVDEAALQL